MRINWGKTNLVHCTASSQHRRCSFNVWGNIKRKLCFLGNLLLFWVNKHFYCFHKSGSFTPSARLHFVILFGIQINFYKAYHNSRHGYICLNWERGNLINLLYIEYQIIGNYLYCISAIPAPSNWWEIMFQIIIAVQYNT